MLIMIVRDPEHDPDTRNYYDAYRAQKRMKLPHGRKQERLQHPRKCEVCLFSIFSTNMYLIRHVEGWVYKGKTRIPSGCLSS